MSRLLRLSAIVLLLLITNLIVDISSVEARWVRLGSYTYILNVEQVCLDGIRIGLAFSYFDSVAQPLPPTRNGLQQDTYRVYLAGFSGRNEYNPNDRPLIRSKPALFDGTITIGYHSEQIGVKVANEQSVTLANYYGFADFKLDSRSFLEKFPAIGAVWAGAPDEIDVTELDIDPITENTVEDCLLFPGAGFTDGRVNNFDTQASAVPYCTKDNLDIYSVDNHSRGSLAVRVSLEKIKAFGTPTQNMLIESSPSPFGGDIRLYLLASGELQINAPGLPPESWKEYVFTWAGCS